MLNTGKQTSVVKWAFGNLEVLSNMNKYVLWLCYIIFCNIVLSVLCALPWYATIFVSGWYAFLAIPFTSLGALLCYEILLELEDYSEDQEEDN